VNHTRIPKRITYQTEYVGTNMVMKVIVYRSDAPRWAPLLYTITFITMFVPTYLVWYVILSGIGVWFTESHLHLVISFCLFANLFLGTTGKLCCIKSQADHVLFT
jgi:hypothetical protein